MSDPKPKVIGSVIISILENNMIVVNTTVQNKVEVRDILKTAEELIIREALQKTSEQPSNIIQLGKVN